MSGTPMPAFMSTQNFAGASEIATYAEVFVDDVGEDEHERPDEHAGREVERAGDAEQRPVEGRRAERGLEGEDLHADEFADQRIGEEETREHQEQAVGS